MKIGDAKRFFGIAFLIVIFSLFIGSRGFAGGFAGGFANATFNNPLKYNSFGELVKSIINFIFTIALVVVPIVIIVGGFYLVTAGGDPNKVQSAKNIILYAIIGFVVIMLSKGLIEVLKQAMGVKGQ